MRHSVKQSVSNTRRGRLTMAIDPLEGRRLMSAAIFAQPVSIATADSPMGVAGADVNGDGRPDLIVASASVATPGFYVHLGDGLGGFGTGTRVATTYTPASIVTGDFDHDGKADVALATAGVAGLNGSVEVFRGLGTGSFGPGVRYASGVGTRSLSTGDLNGDRYVDLVATNTVGNTVSVLTGKPDGTFNAATATLVAAAPISTAIADFDEDGKLDAAVATLTGVQVMLGKGDGTFAAPTTVYSFAQSLSLPLVKLYALDENGNGHNDLVVPTLSGAVQILSGKGDGTFDAPQATPAVPGGGAIVSLADDFDLNGATDLATIDYLNGTLIVDSGATATAAASRATYTIGSGPTDIELIDVNGDHKVDVVTSNSASDTVSVLLNTATTAARAVLNPITRHLDVTGTDDAETITLATHGTQLAVDVGGIVDRFALADIDSVYVNAGAGDDAVDFSTATIPIYASGGYGDDTILGGLANDTLFGSLGDDVLDGGAGADRLGGWKGNDSIFGGEGEDRLYGDQGNDRLDGNSGRDRLWGGIGNDTLNGGQSNDRLYGEAGNDRLIGNVGNDVLSGGDGTDEGDIHAGDLVDSIEVVIQ